MFDLFCYFYLRYQYIVCSHTLVCYFLYIFISYICVWFIYISFCFFNFVMPTIFASARILFRLPLFNNDVAMFTILCCPASCWYLLLIWLFGLYDVEFVDLYIGGYFRACDMTNSLKFHYCDPQGECVVFRYRFIHSSFIW